MASPHRHLAPPALQPIRGPPRADLGPRCPLRAACSREELPPAPRARCRAASPSPEPPLRAADLARTEPRLLVSLFFSSSSPAHPADPFLPQVAAAAMEIADTGHVFNGT